MNQFIVSARKYRPATFDTVVGQQHVTTTLKNAIKSEHLAQAFLFCGPRGVGKTTCARILAKTINCTNLTPETEACDQCESCKSFNSGGSMNFVELDAASNNSVDDIRALVDQVRYMPQNGRYKVYIIDEVHMLSTQAFNAFLKTLEEPPAYAKFILATTERHKILPTILSRCQIFDFNKIKIDDIALHLKQICEKEDVEAEYDGLYMIAQKADGGLRDALSMLDQIISFSNNKLTLKAVSENLNIIDYDYFFNAADFLFSSNISEVLLLLNDVLQKGFDGSNFLSGLAMHFRNLLVTKDPKTIPLLEVGENIKERYAKQGSKIPTAYVLNGLSICNATEITYKSSKNQRLHVELALLKLCFLEGAIQVSQLAGERPQALAFRSTPAVKALKEEASIVDETVPASKLKSQHAHIKFGDLKSGKAQKIVSEMTTIEPEAIVDIPDSERRNNPVLQDDFDKAWQALIKHVVELRKDSLHTIIVNQQPKLSTGYTFYLEVGTQYGQNLLNEERPLIINFLRKELQNDYLLFESRKVENLDEERVYHPNLLYKKMMEDYPILEVLKQKLDLEIK